MEHPEGTATARIIELAKSFHSTARLPIVYDWNDTSQVEWLQGAAAAHAQPNRPGRPARGQGDLGPQLLVPRPHRGVPHVLGDEESDRVAQPGDRRTVDRDWFVEAGILLGEGNK